MMRFECGAATLLVHDPKLSCAAAWPTIDAAEVHDDADDDA